MLNRIGFIVAARSFSVFSEMDINGRQLTAKMKFSSGLDTFSCLGQPRMKAQFEYPLPCGTFAWIACRTDLSVMSGVILMKPRGTPTMLETVNQVDVSLKFVTCSPSSFCSFNIASADILLPSSFCSSPFCILSI